MRLFNPLKPHVVRFKNGTYAIRRGVPFFWQYFGRGEHWFHVSYWEFYIHSTSESAEKILSEREEQENKQRDKGRAIYRCR